MKNNLRIIKQTVVAEKPVKAEVSDEEFRRKLKDVNKWRKKQLAEIRAKSSR